jgi:hypothetical protein
MNEDCGGALLGISLPCRFITRADPPNWAKMFYPHLEIESEQEGNVI